MSKQNVFQESSVQLGIYSYTFHKISLREKKTQFFTATDKARRLSKGLGTHAMKKNAKLCKTVL